MRTPPPALRDGGRASFGATTTTTAGGMSRYADLEKMLFRGFLTCEVDICGIPVVLKSLSPTEYDVMSLQAYSAAGDWTLEAAYALAYSTAFFNHVNMLTHRGDALHDLVACYHDLPQSVLLSLVALTNRVNHAAAQAVNLVQAYACGPLSRQTWFMLKGQVLCDPRLTGFPGTETLGLNPHQRLWIYINSLEDEDAYFQQHYQLAKFIVSPHAPKDVQRIDNKDRESLREREARRRALYDGRDADIVEDANGQIRITNETAEDLLDQMEKAVRGEKDFHDLVVEEHQRRVREAFLQKKAEEARQREEAAQRRRSRLDAEDWDLAGGDGYDAHALDDYMRRADERRMARQGEGHVPLEHVAQSLRRWGFLEPGDAETPRPAPTAQNAFIEDPYETVVPDVNDMRPPYYGGDGD